MKRPDWIESAQWSALTDRQKRIMLEKGRAHYRHMLAWIRQAKYPRRVKPDRASKRESLPRASQWFREPGRFEDRERREPDY